jgi:hypothetical protein
LRWHVLAFPLLALSLSACVGMSRSQAVAPLAVDWARDSHVESITLQHAGLKVRPAFDAIFQQRVKAKLDRCARGGRPLRLEARLDRLDKAHPLAAVLVGGANVLRGSARLVDVATGQVVGDYKVGKTIVGSRFAILVMAEAEEQLSDAFGDELCKQAFAPAR